MMRAPPSQPNYLPKVPPPNTITIVFGIRISIDEFWGDVSVWSKTLGKRVFTFYILIVTAKLPS